MRTFGGMPVVPVPERRGVPPADAVIGVSPAVIGRAPLVVAVDAQLLRHIDLRPQAHA
jgi:hypothetical protein